MRTSHIMNILLAIMVFVLIALVASLALKEPSGSVSTPTNDTATDQVVDDTDTPGTDDEVPAGDDTVTTSADPGNMVVYEPDANDEVGVPLLITGRARVFENQFAYRLTDADGTVLVVGTATAAAPDVGQFGEFSISASYAKPATPTGVLEVFENSAKDGTEINKVTIPVTFAESETMNVNAFFTTSATATDCTTLAAVPRRIAVTQATARASLLELLKGPSTDESTAGYGTAIPSGTELLSISIEGGVATAEFSSALDANVAGSCNVSTIRAQIEQTLKQFTSVTSVVILVDGEAAAEVLQP